MTIKETRITANSPRFISNPESVISLQLTHEIRVEKHRIRAHGGMLSGNSEQGLGVSTTVDPGF